MKKVISLSPSILRSELFRNTSLLISGTTFSQLIPILLQPVLRRSFSVEVFGAYSVYVSVIGILVIITSFKYDVPIILSSNEKEADNVFFLSVIINFAFNVMLFGFISGFKYRIASFLNLGNDYVNYLLFVPLGTFLFGFYQSISNWLLRKKLYYSLTINKFIRRGFEGAVQVGLKLAKFPHFMIYGDIIGHFSNVISGIYQILKNGFSFKSFSIPEIRNVVSKYNEYPKYNLLPALMNACSALLPSIFINKFYSMEMLGYMDLSRMLLMVPVALISVSLSSVILQRTTEKYKEQRSVAKELKSIFFVLLGLGIMEIAVILLFGEYLFMIFGNKWGYSSVISNIIVWSCAISFVVNSFYTIFISLEKIKLLSLWQVFYFLSILSLVLFRNLEFLNFLKIYVVIESLCLLIMAALLIFIIRNYEQRLLMKETGQNRP